jgi:hypothetical protein
MSNATAVTLEAQVQKVIEERVESGTEGGNFGYDAPVAGLWPAITKNRLTRDFSAATEPALLVTTFEK